jgi:hypothetical protein
MSTADPEGTRLEELLLAVLQSRTPLAKGLRARLHLLSIWLLTEFPDEPDGRELMTALMTLRDQGNPVAPGEIPVQPNGSVIDAPEAASDSRASEDHDAEQAIAPEESGAGLDEPQGDITAADDPAPEPEEVDPVEEAAAGLRRLWVKLSDDQVAGRYCQVYGAPEAGADVDAVHELWKRLLLTCLRLPGGQADEIREQAKAAVADYPDKGQLVPLVPVGLPEEDAAELAGLLELAPELAEKWPDLVSDAAWLAWLAWHDQGVECALEAAAQKQNEPVPFEEKRRERFTHHLVNRLKALAKDDDPNGLNPPPIVLVDEAFRGIVPIPLPQPGSWWTDCLERSARRLESPDYPGRIHVLSLELNTETWDKNFDTDVIRIQVAQTAGNHGSNDRVWILRYPVIMGAGALKKGRYIAVK